MRSANYVWKVHLMEVINSSEDLSLCVFSLEVK